jgi:uncharacterized protein (TIGR03083 family)
VQLTPRYDAPPVLAVEPPTGDPAEPMLRQRRRLASVLGTFDDEAWAAPTRCEGWSVRDVVSHLVTTNQFWTISVASGRGGTPTRFLEAFDPVATPAQMVEAARHEPPADVLAAFTTSSEALADALVGIDGDAWATTVESPPGHVSLHAMVLHALWDGWIHERDILLPAGLTQAHEDDEVADCLVYAAALGPAFQASRGSDREGLLAVRATDPATHLVVHVGPAVRVAVGEAPAETAALTGRATELVEALSFRGPFPQPLDAADAWLLGGLGEVFDLTS